MESGSDAKAAGAAASDAIVWRAPSLFIHVTAVPVLTVRTEGLNARLLIVITFPPPDEAGVTEGGAGAGLVEQPAVKQATITRTIQARMNTGREQADIIQIKDGQDKKMVHGTNLRPVRDTRTVKIL